LSLSMTQAYLNEPCRQQWSKRGSIYREVPR
jgi:hypothetical protein